MLRLIVSDLMTRDPVACEANDTVMDVARLMRDKGVGFVVVLRKGKVVGVVTDRQLTVRAVAPGLPVAETPIEAVMTEDPAVIRPDETLFTLIDTLRGAGVVRRIPVVNEQHALVGVVSVSDLAVAARDLIDALLLEETRHALKEVRLPTGGKRVQKQIRSGGASLDLPHHELVPVTRSAIKHAPRRRAR